MQIAANRHYSLLSKGEIIVRKMFKMSKSGNAYLYEKMQKSGGSSSEEENVTNSIPVEFLMRTRSLVTCSYTVVVGFRPIVT